MKTGDVVVYHDARGEARNALVTAVWGVDETPSINIVVVSNDEAMFDGYGRQTARVSSVVHKSHQAAHGQYWRRADEEPNPYQPPAAV